jgi:hypothetical protein
MQMISLEEQTSRPLTDDESFRKVVESIAGRRAVTQKRKSPRYPTARALVDRNQPMPHSGELVCLSPGRQNPGLTTSNRTQYGPSTSSLIETGTENLLHKISWIDVIDFSEEGLQIEFECDNFFDYLDRPLFVRFGPARLPISLHWFKQTAGLLRCGCSFCGAIDKDPGIATTLLTLSDELVHYLVRGERSDNGVKPEMVFAYLSIFQNLRLRFLEAIASFHESKSFILRFVNPGYHARVDHILRRFRYTKYYQLNESKRLQNNSHYKSIIDTFLKPYHRFGCGLLGVGEDMLFLENDVQNMVMNSLLLPDALQSRSFVLGDSVKHAYELFCDLKKTSSETFDSYEYDRQFQCYGAHIGEIVLMREQLIDFLSTVDIHWE